MNSNIMNQTAHAPIPTTSMGPTKMAGSIDSRTRKKQAIVPMSMLLNQGISPSVTSYSVASSVGGFRMNSNAADSKAAFQLVPANQQGAATTSSAVFSLETAETNIPKGNSSKILSSFNYYIMNVISRDHFSSSSFNHIAVNLFLYCKTNY